MRKIPVVLAFVVVAACDNGTAAGPEADGTDAASGAHDGSHAGSDASNGGASDTGGGTSGPDDASVPNPPGDGGGDATIAPVDSGAPVDTDGGPPSTFLPPVQGTCPAIANGTLTFAGQQVQIWAGAAAPATPGSLVIFWYGTNGNTAQAAFLFGQAQINAVTAAGGIVAAISTSNKQGTDTGNSIWYTGDFATADQVVACALDQKRIDPRKIFTTGDSAGGLQAAWMAYARSGYVAAVATLSGGLVSQGGFFAAPVTAPQDPANVPSALVTHGATGTDVYIIDFAVTSAAYEADIKAKGGFSIDCNTGGGHVSGPPVICPAIWQFFQDHPYGVKTSYPSGLPSVYPAYCHIGPRLADGGVP